MPASTSTCDTYRLRGEWRELPLPWANSTMPAGSPGSVKLPGRRTDPATTTISAVPAAGPAAFRAFIGSQSAGTAVAARRCRFARVTIDQGRRPTPPRAPSL
jgi:hypothetical protein